VLLPVLAGEPVHTLGVHCAISCSTPLASVHVTGIPVTAVAFSGVKQNDVPPPLHGPEVIVTPVAAEPVVARTIAADDARSEAATTPISARTRRCALSMRWHGEQRHKRCCGRRSTKADASRAGVRLF
jgi:hypothetical protein